MRGRYLWAPVGEPRPGQATHCQSRPKPARRLDGNQLVEVEIDDRLQGITSSAVAQWFGQRVEPSGVLGLQRDQLGDGGTPAPRPGRLP